MINNDNSLFQQYFNNKYLLKSLARLSHKIDAVTLSADLASLDLGDLTTHPPTARQPKELLIQGFLIVAGICRSNKGLINQSINQSINQFISGISP